jgi:hypothetical protein
VVGAGCHLQGQSVVEVGNLVPVEFPCTLSVFSFQQREGPRWLTDVTARFDDLVVQRLHIVVVAIHMRPMDKARSPGPIMRESTPSIAAISST